MRPTAQIYEVAAMRFLEVNERFSQRELTCEQAAEAVGVPSQDPRRLLTASPKPILTGCYKKCEKFWTLP
jgi:hypothetical protein